MDLSVLSVLLNPSALINGPSFLAGHGSTVKLSANTLRATNVRHRQIFLLAFTASVEI